MSSKIFSNVISAAALLLVSITATAALKTGDMAPDFSVQGADGKTYTLSQFKGKTVVLEWFNKDCPYVRKFYDSKTMQNLQTGNVAEGVIWLTIASSANGKEGFLTTETGSKLRHDRGMGNTALLLDTKGTVGQLYGAKTTPHMFVINKKGELVYQGAIDDQPSANPDTLKKAKNYVSEALASLAKGLPIKDASTTPYGCSVKY